ncbi:phycobilisome degradation protein NblB [Vacuolonema iberomarrocanum]|uniref:phycobilisome degradation protein NblB n=1 Tax=Vacuolonema iberomarrocanum TaxID=3454632 RepID=UPI0019E621B4|nr:HEAT repeat domain-containing protein [filamentous cyanobacterium LEGE 07170]
MSVTPESVRALLESEDFGDRLRGVNHLRQLDPAIAFEMIKPAVTDSHVRVRYAAVSQIASLGTQDLQASLELLRDRLLNDPETDVKAAAADALSALKLTEAFDDLSSLYHQTDEWLLQFSIVAALGEMGDPRGFDLLQEAIQSENELVRTAAVGALGELQDPRAVALLEPFAESDDWQLRYRVVQALGRLRNQPGAQATLQTLTADASDAVAGEAQRYLSD